MSQFRVLHIIVWILVIGKISSMSVGPLSNAHQEEFREAEVEVDGSQMNFGVTVPSSKTLGFSDMLFLFQLAAAMPVDVMPGPNDPANYALPQQVNTRFLKSSRSSTCGSMYLISGPEVVGCL
jgi:hypothetical protein